MGKSRILIVEDEAIVAKHIGRCLEEMGYALSSVVSSGEEAIEKAKSDRPDLILMDIVLSGDIDGITAADRIRSFYSGPIVYLTAYGDEEISVRARMTEPHGYLIKPYDEQELHVTIELALYKHQMEIKLKESEEKYRLLFEGSFHPIMILDRDGVVRMINPTGITVFGDGCIGRSIFDVMHGLDNGDHPIIGKVIESGVEVRKEYEIDLAPGRRHFWSVFQPVSDIKGFRYGIQVSSYDITERKEMEIMIRESCDELEERVQKRTIDLEEAESKLKTHATELEENNAALKVLLRQREEDKNEYENSILSNIKHLIHPYIDKLKRNKPISDELTYLKIIEKNLMEIVSPFAYKLSSHFLGFTPKELQIANLIKDGKQDKDIMEILNISLDTVKVHRKNIRKKLDISGEKVNLRTKLLSLE